MSDELLLSIIKGINVIICLICISIVLLHKLNNKAQSPWFLTIMIVLFALLIFTIFNSIEIYILLFTLLILLYSIITFPQPTKPSTTFKDQNNSNNNAQLISNIQEHERSRIYANLHDDVGAKLLELIYSAKDDTTKNLAKEVLNQIRQAVAKTQNIQLTIGQLIETILTELKSRLESANIDNIENINIHNNNKKLSITLPNVILRILREVTNNVIKHSQADKIQVFITTTEQLLNIEIHDNGIGFVQKPKTGKGISTINKRALSIEAEVIWQSKPNKGTVFTLNYKFNNE